MAPTRTQLCRWLVNGLIAALLVLLVCDAMPFVPMEVREMTAPIANRLGIGHGAWSMFSPPDKENHRLRAEITLAGGRVIQHAFVHPSQQSPWQRFVGHRRSEYVDNALDAGQQHPDVWRNLADWLARQYADQGAVTQVRIIVEISHLPAPPDGQWPPRSESNPFDDQRVVYRGKYR